MEKQTVYVVMVNDRHSDPQAIPFLDRGNAISHARSLARNYSAEHPEDFKEDENHDTWEYYVEYSCEGDRIWVVKEEVIDS